jgi:hypothetical protein
LIRFQAAKILALDPIRAVHAEADEQRRSGEAASGLHHAAGQPRPARAERKEPKKALAQIPGKRLPCSRSKGIPPVLSCLGATRKRLTDVVLLPCAARLESQLLKEKEHVLG